MGIPDYIAQQLRRSPPEDCCVQPDTLPHIAEGYLEEAKIAAVGINPHGAVKRSHYLPMDEGGDKQAWKDKRRYFERRTYGYFTHIERILKACCASFGGQYNPAREAYTPAVALEVVQWATDPRWSGLSEEAKARLREDGAPFFRELLKRNPQIDLLLANGRSVVTQVVSLFNGQVTEWWEHDLGTSLFCGEVLGRRFIGWSTFLSNSPLNNEQRDALAKRVCDLYRNGCP